MTLSVPPVMTSAAVAAAARRCEALSRVHRLATWVGDGRPVTPKHVLRPRDVPAAARVLGFLGSSRINTATSVPALHRPWKVAQAIDFLRIVNGHAVAGPALGQWPDTDDTTVCELWLTGLVTAFAADSGNDDEAGAIAFSRIMLSALATDPPPSVVELWGRARDALAVEDLSIVDLLYRYQRDDRFTAISNILVEFGAATRRGARLVMTPLGRWALHEMLARMPQPISADLPADELLARVADSDDTWQAARPWLIGRDPLLAAREILAAAVAATPAQRIAAVEIVDALDEAAQAAWRDVITVPNLAAHARMALAGWNRPQASSPADSAWLAVEYAMAALTDSGPDEALSCITERIAGQDLDSRMQVIRRSDHPDTAALAEALTLFVASGTKPTSFQVYQLKISLKRMRSPIWRRVLVPATARLGLLHQVIQIVMNWDGDHLHAFSVGNVRYGDPFDSPDLDDEERLRLSDAFIPSIKTITYLYDFGASWYHDIIFEKVLDLDVGTTYPVCVTGSGDFPIEYWTGEDDDQKPVPFDRDKVNSRLAGLVGESD
ncbi:MAG: IS1096 element passenger TnpR family protein [Pseudonocardiaceae bacterium]